MNVIFGEINTGSVVYVLINKCTQTGVPSVGVSSFGAEALNFQRICFYLLL